MIKKILITLFLGFIFIQYSSAQQKLLSKVTVNGFYTTTLDVVLDSFVKTHKLKIVFDRSLAEKKLISERFDNTPLNIALKMLCQSAELHYWVEPDGTIYIVRTPEEVRALQRAQRSSQPLESQSVRTITTEKVDTVRKGGGKVNLQRFKLTGRVVDQLTGESLPGAVVNIENTGLRATTNADGYFTLSNIPADTCVLATAYVGYLSDRLALTSINPKEVLSIGLTVARNNLEEVTIKSKKNDGIMSTDKRKVSVLQISPAKLAELPNLGEKDILRSFQLMPGVSASNESSSGAYVRGGTPDQNLVLFDGFTVYQVDHLYGFFSAFNSNAVKDVQLFKGGFSAKYGGRLSSVTEITGKEGTKKDWNVGGDISLLSANVYLETPVKKNGSFLLALRKSYQGPLYNKIFSQFNKTSTVSAGPGGGGGFGGAQASTTPTSFFYDLNAKYTLNLGQKDLVALSVYQGDDDLDNSRTISVPSFLTTSSSSISPTITDKTTYGNLGSSMKWSRRWNSELYSNTLVSYSSYHSDRDRTNTIGVTNADGTESSVSTGTIERNRLKDWSFKSDWEYQVNNKVKFLFGAYGSAQNVIYKYSQNDTSTLIDQSKDAKTVAAYAEGEFSPWEKLQFKGGVRETYYSPTGKTYFEPRFSGTYTLTDRFTLKAATGRFYQFINRVVREDILSGSRDFWVLANGNSIPVGSANHYIAGFSYETDKYLFDVEGYYKTLNGLTEYSQRLSGNRMSSTLEEHFYNGHGYTSGVEFLLQKKAGKYTGWLSYTMAIARNQFDDYGASYYSANQDARNEFKAVNMYKLGNWTFSATWIFATGKPYTAPIASYTTDNASGSSKTYLTISGKNTERMPAYHRLDLAATLDLIKIDNRKTGSISFSLFNVYNRTNVWYKEYTIYNNQVITTNVNYLGFTPNITLSLKWK